MELKDCLSKYEWWKKQSNLDMWDLHKVFTSEDFQIFANLAQTVLQVSEAEGMPMSLEPTGYCWKCGRKKEDVLEICCTCNCYHNGFNFALDLCTAYIAGKLERVEKIIPNSALILDTSINGCPCWVIDKKRVVTAIRASFGVKGKE